MKNQKYTIDEIVDVQFKKKLFGGLKPAEVDEFLNGVIDDYEYFIQMISDLKKTNEELRNESFKIKMNVLKHATNTLDLSKEEELSEASELVEVRKVTEPVEVIEEPKAFIREEVIITPETVSVEETTVAPTPSIEQASSILIEEEPVEKISTADVIDVNSTVSAREEFIEPKSVVTDVLEEDTIDINPVKDSKEVTAKSDEEIKDELLKLMQEMEALKNS